MPSPIMDIQQIMRYLPHRYPFLLVDKIIDLTPGSSIVGCKNVTFNEPFFVGHFPSFPVMPGVLIIEAMAQTGGIFAMEALNVKVAEDPDTKMFFMSIDKAKFRKPVRPGDRLEYRVSVIKRKGSIWMLDGKAYVDDVLVSEAELKAMVVDK